MKTKLISILFSVFLLCVTLLAHADYRDTPQGKLEAARKYADDFLKEDARPGQQFFQRRPRFPMWRDQPVIDCGMYAVMRSIQTREPYFEDKKQSVVVVPVPTISFRRGVTLLWNSDPITGEKAARTFDMEGNYLAPGYIEGVGSMELNAPDFIAACAHPVCLNGRFGLKRLSAANGLVWEVAA